MKQIPATNPPRLTPGEGNKITNEAPLIRTKERSCQKAVTPLAIAIATALAFATPSPLNCAAGANALRTEVPSGRTQRIESPADVPEGLSRSDWSSIRAEYEKHRHAAFPVANEPGVWQARNPGQQWSTRFDGRGFLAQPEGAEWRWGLELQRYGFAGQERAIERKTDVTTDMQRVTYHRDAALEEWFVNDTGGLEHGFTVKERPAGEGGWLRFELAVRGGLRPEVMPGGTGIRFVDVQGGAVVNYAGLKVWDADGRVLAATFEPVAEGVCVAVEESGARYPLTIDPTAQQAYLKASNAEVSDFFGESVAVSGDTVVVGAFNEFSNATGVNGSQSDNSARSSGAAYVFTVPPGPSVSSINRQTPNGSVTSANSVTYRVTFSESVTGVDTSDFTLTKTGTVAGSVASVSASSGTTIDVMVNSVSGEGTLRLDLNANGTGIQNGPNRAIQGGFTSGQVFTIDNTGPAVAISVPSVTGTVSGPVSYTVTYADDRFNSSTLAEGNIALNKTGDANGSVAVSGSGSTRTVTISGITGSGTLGISIASSTASDTAGNSSLAAGPSFTVTVLDVNDEPAFSAIGDKTAAEGTELSFTASATDVDGDALSFSLASGAPSGATIDSATGTFRCTPGESHGSTRQSITVRVTDNGSPNLTVVRSFAVDVAEVNNAPSIASIGDHVIEAGQTVQLTVTATDSDVPSNQLTFSLDSGAPSGASIDPATGLITWTPTSAQSVGASAFRVRVTDNGQPNLSAAAGFDVEVKATPNTAPIMSGLFRCHCRTRKSAEHYQRGGGFGCARPNDHLEL